MADVVSEVKEPVISEKEIEKAESTEDTVIKNDDSEKNGDDTEEKVTENNEDTIFKKSVENGDVTKNGLSEKESEPNITDDNEVCGIKRKSEVGLDLDDGKDESFEKKQKVEDSVEPDVATNGNNDL